MPAKQLGAWSVPPKLRSSTKKETAGVRGSGSSRTIWRKACRNNTVTRGLGSAVKSCCGYGTSSRWEWRKRVVRGTEAGSGACSPGIRKTVRISTSAGEDLGIKERLATTVPPECRSHHSDSREGSGRFRSSSNRRGRRHASGKPEDAAGEGDQGKDNGEGAEEAGEVDAEPAVERAEALG